MSTKMLAPTRLTKTQYEWLRAEQERTGNPMATIVRNLIQQQLEKALTGNGKA